MKKELYPVIVILFSLAACKMKSKKPEEPAISALSIIKGQLNHLDTSLYQVTKYEMENGHADTTWLQREDIRYYASVFLSLPDIAEDKFRNSYEEERLLDAEQNILSITSTAKDEDAEIQKQIIIVGLDDINNGKVQSIYIDRYLTGNDSLSQQRLFWQVDRFFQVAYISRSEKVVEKSKIIKVEWQ